MKKTIHILNGPNLNLVGIREPEVYGHVSMNDFMERLFEKYEDEFNLEYFQSNSEGELIDHLHVIGFAADGIIFNPGAFTHYSYAIADAIKSIKSPVIEVHISHIYKREEFRRHSVTAESGFALISGFGLVGYELALRYYLHSE